MRYFIIDCKFTCGHCKHATQVIAVVLPEGYESLPGEHNALGQPEIWEKFDVPCLLLGIEFLADGVVNRIRGLAPHFRPDTTGEAGGTCWVNHCDHCGTQLDEGDLHGEPEHALEPTPYEGVEATCAHHVREPFAGWVDRVLEDVPWSLVPPDAGHGRFLEHVPWRSDGADEGDERDAELSEHERREEREKEYERQQRESQERIAEAHAAEEAHRRQEEQAEARKEALVSEGKQHARSLRIKEIQEQALKDWRAHREKLKQAGKLRSREKSQQESTHKESAQARKAGRKGKDRSPGRDDDYSM